MGKLVKIVILYHGSNVEVNRPKLISTKRFLDFGAGFYLTSDLEQAQRWAVRTAKSRGEGTAVVSVFEIFEEEMKSLKVQKFGAANKEWLHYIAANRTGKQIEDTYDVIIGPVANDQTIRTINQYLRGYFSEDVAVSLLLPQKLKDQYAFKSECALNILHFSEVIAF